MSFSWLDIFAYNAPSKRGLYKDMSHESPSSYYIAQYSRVIHDNGDNYAPPNQSQ